MTAAALKVTNLSLAFGGLKAVSEFSLEIPTGGLFGLIGPNGAGKTTVFNLLTGVYRPDTGQIELGAERIDGKKPSQIARLGMARTFQNIRLFGELSVIDNVRTAAGVRTRSGLFRTLLRTPMHVAEERAITERSLELLDFLEITHRRDEQAKSLPYGDQRRLEIARALATEPKVLLLDEPVAGMNTQEKRDMRKLIQSLREQFGVSILLIEHDMGLVMDICEAITVIDHGVTIASGPAKAIQDNPAVIEAYLGVPDEAAASDGAKPGEAAPAGDAAAKAGAAATALLEIHNLDVHYGGIHALKGISMRVEQGEVVTLIGANGAGKTTTLRAISRLVKPSRGTVRFGGEVIASGGEGKARVAPEQPAAPWRKLLGRSADGPHVLVGRGLVHAPEGRGIFSNMTVAENLEIGAFLSKDRAAIARDRDKALALFPRLAERLTQIAGTLSGGEQQMLAIARALLSRPRLLLLDEPSLGLAPQVVALIFRIVKQIAAEGTTILLVEQNAHMALGVASRAYVLEVGQIVLEGPAKDLAKNDQIRKAYLGIHD
jgi:branched-chain amino acid transport system ATP-binding protein